MTGCCVSIMVSACDRISDVFFSSYLVFLILITFSQCCRFRLFLICVQYLVVFSSLFVLFHSFLWGIMYICRNMKLSTYFKYFWYILHADFSTNCKHFKARNIPGVTETHSRTRMLCMAWIQGYPLNLTLYQNGCHTNWLFQVTPAMRPLVACLLGYHFANVWSRLICKIFYCFFVLFCFYLVHNLSFRWCHCWTWQVGMWASRSMLVTIYKIIAEPAESRPIWSSFNCTVLLLFFTSLLLVTVVVFLFLSYIK